MHTSSYSLFQSSVHSDSNMLGNSAFFLSADFYPKINFFPKILSEKIFVSNSLKIVDRQHEKLPSMQRAKLQHWTDWKLTVDKAFIILKKLAVYFW